MTISDFVASARFLKSAWLLMESPTNSIFDLCSGVGFLETVPDGNIEEALVVAFGELVAVGCDTSG